MQRRIIRRRREDDLGCSATTDHVITFDLVDQNPDTGETALHYALTNGQPEILRRLLEANIPVDLPSHLKRTALHLAASNRDPDLTEMILQHSPSLHLPDIVGLTPLLTAQKRVNYDIAVELGYADVAGQLITKGADHLRQNARGLTAKQVALANYDVDRLRVLGTQKSFFLPLRSSTQLSRGFESATTPPVHNGPFVPDFRLSPFRPRPSLPGSSPEDAF